METYQINHTYTLHVDCIQEMPDGRKYVLFKENINGKPLRVKAFGFLSEIGEELPNTIDVVAVSIDVMSGMPLFKVERDWLIKTLYGDEKLPKKYSFNVVDKIVTETYKSLKVKDVYDVQHYFPIEGDDSLDNYSLGERIALIANEIKTNNSGKLYLSLVRPSSTDPITQYIHVFTTRDNIDTPAAKTVAPQPISLGEESETLEFKQSLVYSPKKNAVEVDAQVFNIMRSIAGFMNNNGGTLYIGVKDDGTVKGIESDYPELNGGTSGFGNYTQNWDGWNRKLVDSIRDSLGKFAASLVSVEKMEHDGLTYAKVTVQKALKPIYVHNKILFRRQCNTTSQLTGDELTWFILERIRGEALEQFIEQKYGYETEVVEDADSIEIKAEPTASAAVDITCGAIEDERNHNKWLYLRFFADGHYMGTPLNARVEAYDGAKLVCDYQLEQYQKHENQILLMIYNGSGKVNKIDFGTGKNDWYHTDRNGAIQATNTRNAPWVTEPLVVKCVDRNDMLVAFYKEDNKEYCYVRDIAYIDPSQSDRSKALFTGGHKMPTDRGEIIGKIMHIPGAYRNWIAPIVNKRVETKGDKRAGSVRRLIDILNELYPTESTSFNS